MLTSKQRAYLRSLAQTMSAQVQIGKAALTPEVTISVDEALSARELVKVRLLQNCDADVREVADIISERLHADVVQVIGKVFALYRESEDKRIELPSPKR